MPTLYDLIFGEPEKLAEKKSQFAEMIERGLRVGRGETFEEPLEGFSVLQNKPVGGKPGIVKFDQPEDKDRPLHHRVGEEAFKEFLKRITGASEKATNKFKERMGIADLGGPQYLVEPQFEENLERTPIEEIAGFAGEFAPQIAGGAILQAGLLPGAAAGAAEEFIAGGDEEDILFSALGGGVGGLLGKLGKGLGEEGVKRLGLVDDLQQELTGVAKAVNEVSIPSVIGAPEVPLTKLEAKDLLALREAQIIGDVGKFEREIIGRKVTQRSNIFNKKDPVMFQTDTIMSKWLEKILPRKDVRPLMKILPDTTRLQMAREVEISGMFPAAKQEVMSSAENLVRKTFEASGLTKKEIDTTVKSLDSDVILKLAKQYDTSAATSARKVTASVCQALATSRRIK